jgi:hypothetical protein
MEDEWVSVRVRDGFLKSFAASFVERFGEDSLFVRTVSDLWTTALARMLIEKGLISESDPVALFSDAEAVGVLRALSSEEALKEPLLQETLGYSDGGAIADSFDSTFGAGSFAKWLTAFEKREFGHCAQLSRRLV